MTTVAQPRGQGGHPPRVGREADDPAAARAPCLGTRHGPVGTVVGRGQSPRAGQTC